MRKGKQLFYNHIGSIWFKFYVLALFNYLGVDYHLFSWYNPFRIIRRYNHLPGFLSALYTLQNTRAYM